VKWHSLIFLATPDDDGRRDEKRSCELALVDSSCFRRSCVTPTCFRRSCVTPTCFATFAEKSADLICDVNIEPPTCFATFADESADLFRDGTCSPSTCRERGLPFWYP
jgi:hypothetical protein